MTKIGVFMPHGRTRHRGFTIIELMVVVTIVAIGAGLALPEFASFLRRNSVTGTANELLSAINRARAEASRTGSAGVGSAGVPYTVCASANSTVADVPATPVPACTATPPGDAWTAGAIVFADADGDGVRDAGEPMVLSLPPAPGRVEVTLSSAALPPPAAVRQFVLFAPNGKLHGDVTGMRFTVRHLGSSVPEENRYVCVARGGRPVALSHTNIVNDARYDACQALAPAIP